MKKKKKKQTTEESAKPTFDVANKRGTRLTRGRCSRCGDSVASPVWRYTGTTAGDILICSRCKPFVFDESRKKIDALDRSTGGAFESNRRRH